MSATPEVRAPRSGEITRGVIRWAVKSVVFSAILAAVLFSCAGRVDWARGWLYLGIVLAVQIADAAVLIPRSADLLAERSKMQEGAKRWDVPLAAAMAWTPMVVAVIAALDERFDWSPEMGIQLSIFAALVGTGGALFTLWAMAANRFFSGLVRIQSERGHTVASAGPYRFVRHPGYVGATLFSLLAPLMLASLWAFIPAAAGLAVTAVRTALEDRTLQAELPGYAEYARRVRYRLLPGIW